MDFDHQEKVPPVLSKIVPPSPPCCVNFSCHICMDSAQYPVVTLCGHLFCWPCLFTWFITHEKNLFCPSCRSRLLRIHIIPLYQRNEKPETVPIIKGIPNRPKPPSFNKGLFRKTFSTDIIFQTPSGDTGLRGLVIMTILLILWYLFA